MRWVISKPPVDTLYFNDNLNEGIELFIEIVEHNKHASEVKLKGNPKNEATLRHLLRNIFVAGLVRIVEVERDFGT